VLESFLTCEADELGEVNKLGESAKNYRQSYDSDPQKIPRFYRLFPEIHKFENKIRFSIMFYIIFIDNCARGTCSKMFLIV
jgi:hypothetical protein